MHWWCLRGPHRGTRLGFSQWGSSLTGSFSVSRGVQAYRIKSYSGLGDNKLRWVVTALGWPPREEEKLRERDTERRREGGLRRERWREREKLADVRQRGWWWKVAAEK